MQTPADLPVRQQLLLGESAGQAGGLSEASAAPACLAIGPGVSPQRTWAVHTCKLSSSSPDNSICGTHGRGSNASRGERTTVLFVSFCFVFCLLCSQSLLKAQDTAAGEPSSPGFSISRPSPSSPRTQRTLCSPRLNDVSLRMLFQHRNCGFKRKICSVALGTAQ